MSSRLIRVLSIVGLMLSALTLSACSSNQASPSSLTGDTQTHERHATGIDSQVNDR